ncbi:MAG TPA: hypothetical protein VIL30_18715 [Ramlibacter sp.]
MALGKRSVLHGEHPDRIHKRQLKAIHDKAKNGASEMLKNFRDDFIRESNETSAALAARHDLSPSAVRMIRLRSKWED